MMAWRTGKRILESVACNPYIPESKIAVPVLYGENYGVWIHMQRELKRNKAAKAVVIVMYTGKKIIGKDRYRLENKLLLTQPGSQTNECKVK